MGTMLHPKFIERRPKFWAGGFLFDAAARKVLLHLRDRQTLFNPNRWAFFGGLNDGNESFGECFIRELHEEIGLQVAPHRVTYLRDYARTTVAQHRAVFYALSDVPAERLTLGEGAGRAWIALAEISNFDLTAATREDLEYFVVRMNNSVWACELRIVPAREESLPAINALIARSKAYWTWPAEYLEQALALLAVDVDYLRTHQSFEVLDARSDLVSFVAIAALDPIVVLDHLWVTPERIGHGIGRRACEYVIQFAREHQWSELSVLPDPPSEGFYLRMNFEDSGKRVPSRVPGGPLFSVYRLRL